jgi:pSer/pThr/pTyr-binding forkhead associated (FHA) protein
MSDQLLNTLKVALLALLYLFFARVLWAVWSEVRVPVAAGLSPKANAASLGSGSRAKLGPAQLLMVEPAARRGSVTVLEGDVVVGRAPECTVVMPDDPYTSTRHARFFERDGAWWVEDLGSTNGTLVNAKTITEAQQLKRDDRVQTGSAVFEVQ